MCVGRWPDACMAEQHPQVQPLTLLQCICMLLSAHARPGTCKWGCCAACWGKVPVKAALCGAWHQNNTNQVTAALILSERFLITAARTRSACLWAKTTMQFPRVAAPSDQVPSRRQQDFICFKCHIVAYLGSADVSSHRHLLAVSVRQSSHCSSCIPCIQNAYRKRTSLDFLRQDFQAVVGTIAEPVPRKAAYAAADCSRFRHQTIAQ